MYIEQTNQMKLILIAIAILSFTNTASSKRFLRSKRVSTLAKSKMSAQNSGSVRRELIQLIRTAFKSVSTAIESELLSITGSDETRLLAKIIVETNARIGESEEKLRESYCKNTQYRDANRDLALSVRQEIFNMMNYHLGRMAEEIQYRLDQEGGNQLSEQDVNRLNDVVSKEIEVAEYDFDRKYKDLLEYPATLHSAYCGNSFYSDLDLRF